MANPKVLAILGSPRKNGNGFKATQRIEASLRARGDIDFTYMFLRDMDLGQCLGCFQCVARGEEHCPLRDDKAKIDAAIEASDAIILVSPGYVQNVSGLMKNFMDRYSATNHRLRWFDKKMLLVANGGAGLDKTLDALSIAIGGPQIVAKIAFSAPPWPLTDAAEAKNEKAIEDAATKLHSALRDRTLPAPGLNDLMRFMFLKRVSAECREWLPADYEYYAARDRYFYETSISPVTQTVADFLVPRIMGMMKDMGPRRG